MPVPTHRPDCHTSIWRTNCLDCGAEVYYFSCTCGSKVFFDQKEPPWPLHGDHCPRYQIRLLLNEGYSADQVQGILEDRSIRDGIAIPVEIINYLHHQGASGKRIYNEILPSEGTVEISGFVEEIRDINFYRRLDLPENMITRNALRKFSSRKWTEVIILSHDQRTERVVDRWTFIIPSEELSETHFRVGLSITAELQAEEVFEDIVFWVCKFIDWK